MSWRGPVSRGCLTGARWALYASVLAPLVYTTRSVYPFVVPAALWFRLAVSGAGVLAAAAVLSGGLRARPGRDPVAGGMALFLAAGAVAALAGEAPLHSLFGSYERMGGVVSWAHYLALYVLLRAVLDREAWTGFLWLLVASTALVAGIGALQAWGGAAGWHPLLGMDRVQATLGNPGFLSIYLLLGLVACGLLARRVSDAPSRVLVAAIGLLEAAVLMLSTIRSTLQALSAGLAAGAAALALAGTSRSTRRLAAGAAALVAAAAGGLWLGRGTEAVRSIPTLEETAETGLGESSLRTRFAAWEAALAGVAADPVLGVGPENYRLVFARHFPPRLHRIRSGTPPYFDEAHDDYLESAVETGLVGFLAFLLFWAAAGRRAWRLVRRGRDPPTAALVVAAVVAYAVFLLAWFRTPTTFPAFVALLAYAGAVREDGGAWLSAPAEAPGAGPAGAADRTAAGAALALFLAGAVHTVALARPAHLLAAAGRAPSVAARVQIHEAAVATRVPGAKEVGEEYGRFMAGLDPDALEGVSGERRAAVERGFRGAEGALAAEVARDPASDRSRALVADLAFNRFRFDGDSAHLERGIEAARAAVERSPPRLRYRRMLSDLLMTAGRPREARAALEEARALLGGVGELHYAIAKIHAAEGRLAPAVAGLERADSLGYEPERSNRPVYATVAHSLLAAGDTARARRVLGFAGGSFDFGDGGD